MNSSANLSLCLKWLCSCWHQLPQHFIKGTGFIGMMLELMLMEYYCHMTFDMCLGVPLQALTSEWEM